MGRRSEKFIWQFVIGLGFLSGIWTAIGIDPEEVLLNALGTATSTLYPDPALKALFLILPVILLLVSVWGAYKKGRIPGLAAVFIAYCAGLSLLISAVATLLLLMVAIVLAYLVTRRRR
jgi:hypothetical protein